MDKTMAQEMGYLGVNVESCTDLAWLQSEVVNKMKQGDKTSAYRLLNLARHSTDEAVKEYAIKLVQANPDFFGGDAIYTPPVVDDTNKGEQQEDKSQGNDGDDN